MSRTPACEFGGRPLIMVHTVRKVPHVQGKSSEFRCELMEGVGVLECGKDRFWIRRYLPGLPVFGTKDSGEDWNGPISHSRLSFVNGPKYLPFLNSVWTISSNTWESISVDSLLSGVNDRDNGGMPASAPRRMNWGIRGYFLCRLNIINILSQ